MPLFSIGRKRWTLAAALVVAGFAGAGNARAADPSSAFDLASQVQASVETQVDGALAEAQAAVASAQQTMQPLQQPAAAPAPAAPVSIDVSIPSPADVLAAQSEAAPAPQRSHAERPKAPRRQPRHARRSPRAAAPRAAPSVERVTGSSAQPPTYRRARHDLRAHPQAAKRLPRRTPAPASSIPPRPTAPGLPDPGASASSGGPGSGAGAPLLVLLAVIGGSAAFGIRHLLRKVLWSDLWVPRPVALAPWRPG
jgi:hypothetical protein